MSNPLPFSEKHETLLFQVAATQNEHSAKLDEHSAILHQHSAKLDDHSAILHQHSAKLDDHSTDIRDLKTRMDDGFRRMDILFEDQNSKLDTIMDMLIHLNTRAEKQDRMETTLENHEIRLSAVENFLKP